MPGLGASFGRGAATTYQQDLANSDCILIMGSNMAEAHPVGFRWPMKAKEKGATLIPPFDDPHIVTGQGTVGLDVIAQMPDVDNIVVPLGGATLDIEENYLIKKLFGGGLGVVSIENQARI